jgi:hypothetical protein
MENMREDWLRELMPTSEEFYESQIYNQMEYRDESGTPEEGYQVLHKKEKA